MKYSSVATVAAPLFLTALAHGQAFGPQLDISAMPTPFSYATNVQAGDIDLDGHVDVVGLENNGLFGGGLEVVVYRGLGAGAFLPQEVLLPNLGASSLLLEDLDADGLLDVVASFQSLFKVSWYRNLGSPGFGPEIPIGTLTGLAGELATLDLDDDGDPDVLIGMGLGSSPLGWFLNQGGGVFGPLTLPSTYPTGLGYPTGLDAADVDADGVTDLLIANSSGMHLMRGLGAGMFGLPQSFVGTVTDAAAVLAEDWDKDGILDVAFSAGGEIQWMRGLGGGTYAASVVLAAEPSGLSPDELLARDFEGDGDLDLVASSPYPSLLVTNTLFWIENLGSGSFAQLQPVSIATTAINGLTVGDLDGDFDLDLVVVAGQLIAWHPFLPGPSDCNGNGVADTQDLLTGLALDCNLNGVPDSCDIASGHSIDINGDSLPDECVAPPLMADVYELSVATGGVQSFVLTAPYALDFYLLLGTTSGTSPGIPVGGFVVPLNYDGYLLHTATYPSSPPLSASFGVLAPSGSSGTATASFTLPPAFSPALVGLTVHHAYVTIDLLSASMTFVSNAVPLALLP